MGLGDRLSALAPYAEQLAYDEEVQAAARRAVDAARRAYGRARGKSARQAAQDKRLRRLLLRAADATRELRDAIETPRRRRQRRRRRGLVIAAVCGAATVLASNADFRQAVLGLLGKNGQKTSEQSQEP